MIKKIRLKNWKSHKNTEFEFRKGTNVLTGIIGAGKSSVVEALCYSLFGTYPALNSKSVSLNEIIMNKPNQMDYAKTELEFDYKGKNYLIERTVFLGKNSNQAKLFREGTLIAGPKPKDVNEKIQETIEMNYDLFSRAVYSEQNQIDFFLKLSPSERKKKFDEILDLEKYEKARKTNISVMNTIKRAVQEKKETIKRNSESINETELKQLKNKKEKKEKENQELKEKKETTKKELEENIEELEKLSEKEKKFTKLNEQKIKTESKIFEAEKKLKEEKIELKEGEKEKKEFELTELKKEKKEMEEKRKKVSEIQVKLNTKKERKKLLEKEAEKQKKMFPEGIETKEKIKTEKEKKEFELKETTEKIKETENLIEKTEKNFMEIKEGLLFNKKRIKELEENIKKLSRIESGCPVCSTKLSKEKKIEIINSCEKETEKLEIINKGLEQETKKSNEDKNELKKEKKEFELKEKKIEEKIKEIESLSEILNELNKNLEKINELKEETEKLEKTAEEKETEISPEKTEKIETKIKKTEKIIELLKNAEELNEWKKELKKIIQEKNELNYKENSFSEKKEETTKQKSLIESIQKQTEMNSELIESIKENIQKIEKEKKRIKEAEKEVEKNEEMLTKLALFSNALNETQSELRKEMINTINDAMADVWSRIYPYGDFTSAKMIIEKGNYEIKVKEKNGKWTRVEGILSGGERSAAAICIRVAFSLVLTQNLSWLILDEPTHNLDKNAVKELSAMMKNHLPNLVEQIFVITHDPEMEKAASGECYEIERNKENEGSSIPKTTETN